MTFYKKIFHICITSLLSIFFAVSVVLAWTGITAETGDIITVDKWIVVGQQ